MKKLFVSLLAIILLVGTMLPVHYAVAQPPSLSPTWTMNGGQTEAGFGCYVGTAGDVNGDGYDDIIVGAVHYDNGETNEGRACVYYGSSAGFSIVPDWTAESNQVEGRFGASVATAGDVNGDGYDDVIIGAYAYDKGQTNEGVAFVYHGSPTGLDAAGTRPIGTPDNADWVGEINQAVAYYGVSVGTAGDVNADGYDDVIVG
ncbi:MAG: integrin alpha, partial [Dehalococcoidia bacterium]